ncbi:NUDIX domain protein [compost metagenome]
MKTKLRATVICVRRDRVLLVSKDGQRWALPGGRPGKGETVAETAIRELEEETSLVAKGLDFAFQMIGATTVHHVFAANLGKAAMAKPNREILHCQWFTPSDLHGNGTVVSTTTRRIIGDYFKTSLR